MVRYPNGELDAANTITFETERLTYSRRANGFIEAQTEHVTRADKRRPGRGMNLRKKIVNEDAGRAKRPIDGVGYFKQFLRVET